MAKLQCDICGGQIIVQNGGRFGKCANCDAHYSIAPNENEYIYRHIDEAKIKEAEMTQVIELKKLEILERKRAAEEKTKKIKIIISIILGVVGAVMMIVSDLGMGTMIGMLFFVAVMYIWIIGADNKEKEADAASAVKAKMPAGNSEYEKRNKVKVPGISGYEKKNYVVIEELFKGAGFTEVKSIPLHDLKTGLIKKPGMVESITINGKEIVSGGRKFSPDSKVVISYHSFVC